MGMGWHAPARLDQQQGRLTPAGVGHPEFLHTRKLRAPLDFAQVAPDELQEWIRQDTRRASGTRLSLPFQNCRQQSIPVAKRLNRGVDQGPGGESLKGCNKTTVIRPQKEVRSNQCVSGRLQCSGAIPSQKSFKGPTGRCMGAVGVQCRIHLNIKLASRRLTLLVATRITSAITRRRAVSSGPCRNRRPPCNLPACKKGPRCRP